MRTNHQVSLNCRFLGFPFPLFFCPSVSHLILLLFLPCTTGRLPASPERPFLISEGSSVGSLSSRMAVSGKTSLPTKLLDLTSTMSHGLEEKDLGRRNTASRVHRGLFLKKFYLVNYDNYNPRSDDLGGRDLRDHNIYNNDFDDLENADLERSYLANNELDKSLTKSHVLENDDVREANIENSTNPLETKLHSTAQPQNASLVNQTDSHAYRRFFNSLKYSALSLATSDAESKRNYNVTKYRVFHGGNVKPPSAIDLPNSVNLMIIPLGAIFVFIVLGVLHISRWCIEDIREADGMLAKRYPTSGFISNCGIHTSRQLQVTAITAPRLSPPELQNGRSSGALSSTDLARIHNRNRILRQTRIIPARSTRSLNGIRDRNCERLNRKLAIGSDSSIQMIEMASSSRYYRHGDRCRAAQASDGIVENCKRAVGSFLQSHVIVVPVDRNYTTGNTTIGPKTRTRNFSSPASSSKTVSSCSESRPLLARGSSSSDGRMTSSDSNIDVMSPVSVRRRLAGETRNYRTKPACVNSAGNLANRIVAFQHGRHPGKIVGYSHQSSAPAVSKLVHDSLNLSFRFFQVPLYSDPSSGKESMDSVFVCGIYTDDTSTAATSSVNDALLKPDVVEGYDGPAELIVSCKYPISRLPRASKDRTTASGSIFDRQVSVDESKTAQESSHTLTEVDNVSHIAEKTEIRQRCDSGVTLRRSRSANELHLRHAGKERSAKYLTA